MKKVLDFVVRNKWFIATLLIVAGLFYWYEWRPAQIKNECAVYSTRLAIKNNASLGDIEELREICVGVGGVDRLGDILNENK